VEIFEFEELCMY